ncbi:MAG: cation:proton antiporter [Melioribacteraceae bacterium]|nr:cation:proton antiporter [Melioribacteraceae bacterium]
MHDVVIIQDIVIILVVALPIIFIFKRIDLPPIVGYLIAGMIIGPYGLALIKGIDQIEVMAEIGVVLLLFTIGLEVSLKQLLLIRKYLLVAGGSQVVSTILISALIFYVAGIELNKAIYLGMLLSLSSTAIVLKILSEKGELDAPHGRISLGVLLFQDLAIVPMFILLPILNPSESLSFGEVALKLLIAFGTLALVLVLAKYLMPKITYQLAKLHIKEAFTVGIILLLLGTAYVTHSLGLSLALGSFIAGLILAESEYSTQIVADILPLRDVFNSIFFVSVGLLLNIGFVVEYPVVILSATFAVILLKSVIIILIVLSMKYPARVALLAALGLAQVGEFSFVLAQAGSGFKLMTEEYYNIFLASSIFTMILTPFLFKLAPMLAFKTGDILPAKEFADNVKTGGLAGHVIIAGFGLNGKNLARVLKETGIKYVVLELNPDTVKEGLKNGEKIIYGDVSKEEVLNHVNVKSANVLVFAIADPLTTRRALVVARKINSKLYTVVRTRFVNEIDELRKLGADEIIPEEFETSLEIFKMVLRKYHIPLNIIMKQTAILRHESYKFLRKGDEDSASFIHLDEILAEGLTETYYVNDDNPHINKALSQLNLRAKTGATIIAIVRNGITISNPAASEKIIMHDTLVITGTHESVDEAIVLLDNTDQQK